MKHTTIFFLVMLSFVVESFTNSWVYSSSPSATTPKKCIEPGLLCETCTSLVACIEDGNGTFFKEHLANCSDPLRCVGGSCVQNTTDPFCSGLADLPFICRKVGIFPDPFYCNKFVLCVNDSSSSSLKPHLNECEEGFKFNIVTSLCDIRLQNEQCQEGEYPVPLCEAVGQTGALPEKPEVFYICEEYNNKLYPVLNVCPGGEVYDNYRCVNAGSTSTSYTITTIMNHNKNKMMPF